MLEFSVVAAIKSLETKEPCGIFLFAFSGKDQCESLPIDRLENVFSFTFHTPSLLHIFDTDDIMLKIREFTVSAL